MNVLAGTFLIFSLLLLGSVFYLIRFAVRSLLKKEGLFLDDERNPKDVTWVKYPRNIRWKIVTNVGDFLKALHNGPYEVISFDHDLGGTWHPNYKEDPSNTGMVAVKKLIELHMDGKIQLPKKIAFHSKNPIGVRNMESYWNSYVESLKQN